MPGKVRWIGYKSRARGSYGAEFCINSQGDALETANRSDLRLATPFRVGACPPEYPFGTVFVIEGFGNMTCIDRGGAIKGKRLDLWTGIGSEGVDNYVSSPSSGMRRVTVKRF